MSERGRGGCQKICYKLTFQQRVTHISVFRMEPYCSLLSKQDTREEQAVTLNTHTHRADHTLTTEATITGQQFPQL
jgi:hypothetical protein